MAYKMKILIAEDNNSLLEIISTKHGISKEELYNNRSKTEGFN
jgi:hypothetical protein